MIIRAFIAMQATLTNTIKFNDSKIYRVFILLHISMLFLFFVHIQTFSCIFISYFARMLWECCGYMRKCWSKISMNISNTLILKKPDLAWETECVGILLFFLVMCNLVLLPWSDFVICFALFQSGELYLIVQTCFCDRLQNKLNFRQKFDLRSFHSLNLWNNWKNFKHIYEIY